MAPSRSPSPAFSIQSPINSVHSSEAISSNSDDGEHALYRSVQYGQRPSLSTHSTAHTSSLRIASRETRDNSSGGLVPQGEESPSGEDERDHDDSRLEHGEEKKKRTRTLTTPYQSAVLHALLAQSRFPTTQMREDVGRSIGLSARKVQIWFQNQRQKAKRNAQGQTATTMVPAGSSGTASHGIVGGEGSDITLSDPVAHALSVGRSQLAGGHSVGGVDTAERPRSHRGTHSSHPYARPLSSGSLLLGPATPGGALSSLDEDDSRVPRSIGHQEFRFDVSHPARPPFWAGRGSLQSTWRHRRGSSLWSGPDLHSFAAIPPSVARGEVAGGPTDGTSAFRPSTAPMTYGIRPSTATPSSPVIELPPMALSSPPESPFAHILPDLPAVQACTSSRMCLPRPTTLEPAPQWDMASFSPYWRRPSSSSSSHYELSGDPPLPLGTLRPYTHTPVYEPEPTYTREHGLSAPLRESAHYRFAPSSHSGTAGPSRLRLSPSPRGHYEDDR